MNSKDFKDKFKNITAISFGTLEDSLLISFHGFESQEQAREFSEILFAKVNMTYSNFQEPVTFH